MPYRLDIHSSNLRQECITAMSDFFRFERHIPAPLLFVESAQKDIHLMMQLPFGSILIFTAVRALTFVD
jgi:hypothetical protein